MRSNRLSRCSSSSRNIKIYGPIDKRAMLEPKLVWATPGQRGFAASKAPAALPAPQRFGARGAPLSASQVAGPSYSQYTPVPAATSKLTAAQIAAQQEAVRKQQEAFAKAHELQQILNNLEKVDDEGRRVSLLDSLTAVDDVLGLPEHPSPPGKGGDLKVDLMKHQVRTVDGVKEYLINVLSTETRPAMGYRARISKTTSIRER